MQVPFLAFPMCVTREFLLHFFSLFFNLSGLTHGPVLGVSWTLFYVCTYSASSCVLQYLICGKFKRNIRIEVASWVGERHEGTFWASTNALQTEETDTWCITCQNSGCAPLK